ncbi:peptidyl-prolyl cis-trans isomerase A [Solimonas fluminis]|uniref:Peptidyl-prolyl cis-trans isomerase n=1 Tax=Solimonas fluminis TaxID=2086571 RepID=A0A2S5TCD6_9GAMM|nr:peptidyl-prolyl cis-trans isomerase A [Solimonas fluminis]
MKQLLLSLALGLTMSIANAAPVQVLMETTEGNIKLELDSAKAPKSVANFVQYAKDGHYDGLVFHRVISGFMIQGGGYDEKNDQRKTRAPIDNEAKNGLKNDRGTIAMARTSVPNSATSQFFINHGNNDFLNYPGQDGWGYAVFGKVTEGLDVVDKIAATRTGNLPPFGRDVPVTPIVIRKVTIIEAK